MLELMKTRITCWTHHHLIQLQISCCGSLTSDLSQMNSWTHLHPLIYSHFSQHYGNLMVFIPCWKRATHTHNPEGGEGSGSGLSGGQHWSVWPRCRLLPDLGVDGGPHGSLHQPDGQMDGDEGATRHQQPIPADPVLRLHVCGGIRGVSRSHNPPAGGSKLIRLNGVHVTNRMMSSAWTDPISPSLTSTSCLTPAC